MSGGDVRQCQRMLNRHGLAFVQESGTFDTPTMVGVRAFQSMNNLKPTGHVDDPTWSLLASQPKFVLNTVTGERLRVIDQCWQHLGAPYLHGGEHQTGMDPTGFLTLTASNVWPLTWKRGNTLHEFLTANCTEIKPDIALPADVLVYSRDDGRPTHVLVKLNDQFGIGPLGGNAATNTAEMALKRHAYVMVKNIHYRPIHYAMRFNNVVNPSE